MDDLRPTPHSTIYDDLRVLHMRLREARVTLGIALDNLIGPRPMVDDSAEPSPTVCGLLSAAHQVLNDVQSMSMTIRDEIGDDSSEKAMYAAKRAEAVPSRT